MKQLQDFDTDNFIAPLWAMVDEHADGATTSARAVFDMCAALRDLEEIFAEGGQADDVTHMIFDRREAELKAAWADPAWLQAVDRLAFQFRNRFPVVQG